MFETRVMVLGIRAVEIEYFPLESSILSFIQVTFGTGEAALLHDNTTSLPVSPVIIVWKFKDFGLAEIKKVVVVNIVLKNNYI